LKRYDEIVGFDYTSIEGWRGFVKDDLVPLYASVLKFLRVRNHLEKLLKKDAPNLIKNNQSVRKVLLGGINKEGVYSPNSLASLIKELLGIYINPMEWVSYSKQKGIDVSEYIEINIQEYHQLNFLNFIKEIKRILEKVLEVVGLNPPEINQEDIKELVETPETLVAELKTIYSLILNISANYNYRTFFILNTKLIPKYYIERVYLKLRESFEELAEFLGLEIKHTINIKGKKSEYAILGHKENGLADLIYSLNYLIWKHFSKTVYCWENGEYVSKNIFHSSFGKIGEIFDLKNDFFVKLDIFSKISGISISNNISTKKNDLSGGHNIFNCKKCKKLENFRTGHWIDLNVYDLKFSISDGNVVDITHKFGYTQPWDGKKRSEKESNHNEENLRVMDLISNISPLLFLDVINVQFNKNLIRMKAKI